MTLTAKERCVLQYLEADEGGATCAEIGLAVAPKETGAREWAGGTLRNLHRKGMAYTHGIAVGIEGRASIWHIDSAGIDALRGEP